MATDLLDRIRTSLTEKRAAVAGWLETASPSDRQTHLGPASEEQVRTHLDNIDTCLHSADLNELGICEICHDMVNPRLLEMDYTACVCLDHFSPAEKHSLETELELAQTVQRSLLPQQIPETPYLEIAAFSRPAQLIGGDYFDFIPFSDGAHGLAIADVAGHGVSAALHMASIQALLRTLIPISSSPAEVSEHVQRLLIHNVRFANFVTLFLAAYDPTSRRLKYSNAGHNPPLLLSSGANGETSQQWLRPTGAAIGLVEGMTFGEAALQVQPGDILILYTDGVTEAMRPDGEQFGYERLAQATARWANVSSRELVQGIRQELLDFTGQETQADDVTLIVCRITS